jgi:hypothetical protein
MASVADGQYVPFAHVLLGGARTSFSGGRQFGNTNVNVSESSMGFAAAAGGGLDIAITDSVTLRAVQADYSHFRFTLYGLNDSSNGVRISSGIVFRF